MENMVINGVENQPVQQSGEKLCIAIIDNRGLTMVGYFDPEKVGDGFVKIRKARCIIRWGTKGHLAQLANTGKTPETVLGDEADIYAKIYAYYICKDEKQWE